MTVGGIALEERVEDVLRNYELELLRAYRVRGAYLLETRPVWRNVAFR